MCGYLERGIDEVEITERLYLLVIIKFVVWLWVVGGYNIIEGKVIGRDMVKELRD